MPATRPSSPSASPIIARLGLAVLPLLSLLAGPLAAQTGQPTVSCAFAGRGTSDVFHGFYVTGYTGRNLSTVTLGYTTDTAGLFRISLTAHRAAYNGPMIGATQTATVNVGTSGETLVIFDFGAAPVSPGDTIAFTQTAGQLTSVNDQFGNLFFDAGRGSCARVFETMGTAAPLDTVIQPGVGVAITQDTAVSSLGAPCIPSDTVLCLDDTPGDQRFQITASFHTAQGGGLSGKGQATPLGSLGTAHGGLYWFFDPATPEMLVKVVNGCALNDRYWVFISAATNVGFNVTVTDTALAGSKTYTNPDRTAAVPVQDTTALAHCHACTSNAQCPTGLLCCHLPAGPNACVKPAPGGSCPLFP
jgi:hypothetical protein